MLLPVLSRLSAQWLPGSDVDAHRRVAAHEVLAAAIDASIARLGRERRGEPLERTDLL